MNPSLESRGEPLKFVFSPFFLRPLDNDVCLHWRTVLALLRLGLEPEDEDEKPESIAALDDELFRVNSPKTLESHL